MGNLADDIRALRQDREDGLIDDELYRDLLTELKAEHKAKQAQKQVGDFAAKADGAGAIAAAAGARVTKHENQFFGTVYQGKPTDDTEKALNIYRSMVRGQTAHVSLMGIDKSAVDSHTDSPLKLANVYIGLNTKQSLDREEKKRVPPHLRATQGENRLTALKACDVNKKMVLLGDPGGGKSTFVNHLAHGLVCHQLAEKENQVWQDKLCCKDSGLNKALLEQIPLLIILRDFAAELPNPLPKGKHAPFTALCDFIKNQLLAAQNLGFAIDHLFTALDEGRVTVLCDGLDEVTATHQRRFVRDAVSQFAQTYKNARYIVTCRVLSYQPPKPNDPNQTPDLRLKARDFPTFELAEFDVEQQAQFIDGWYNELIQRHQIRSVSDGRKQAKSLKDSVRQRGDLRRLAGNPLLLTIMAVVHTYKGKLPDGRAKLYDQTIEVLLWEWDKKLVRQNEDETDTQLQQLLNEVGRNQLEFLETLAAVAFEVHHNTEPDPQQEQKHGADIQLAQLYRNLGRLGNHGWAERVTQVMKERAGLLIERQPDVFSFPHRTFQEYLAGVYLANHRDQEGQPDFPQQATALAHLPQWRIVILLAVGYLTYVSLDKYRNLALLRALVPNRPPRNANDWLLVWLAAEAICEMGAQRVQDTEDGSAIFARVHGRLTQLITEGQLTPQQRMQAGMVLGKLGDTRRGVGLAEDGYPQIEWGVEIPSATYTLETGQKKRVYDIKHNYRLAQYPITYSQFQAFVTDTSERGYHCTEWWFDMPEKETIDIFKRTFVTKEIDEARFPYNNHPRETVSWYQAVAFCRWLSDKLPYEVRLPHEDEWEVAARWDGIGIDGRTYPWGNKFERDLQTNTSESELSQTTAVGMYPAGFQSGSQLYDMGGNVFEWCLNKFEYPTFTAVDTSGNRRVLRGGSWVSGQNFARAASRSDRNPYSRRFYLGFRVCRASPPISS